MGEAERILVVDDDDEIRGLLTTWLRHAGYTCTEAADGATALRALGDRLPDLVLLDIVLPGVSGYEICRKLRLDHGEGIAIVFLSGARVDPLDRAVGLMLGADDYLTKPVLADELLARVRRLLAAKTTIDLTESAAAASPLTNRETEVLALLAKGLDGPAIGRHLVISTKTVTSHVQRVMAKLGVHTRAQAVARAYADGILEVEALATGHAAPPAPTTS